MTGKIKIPLNQEQREKIKKKFGEDCSVIEIDKTDLINSVKYMPGRICIDFDDQQEKEIQRVFPGKECDFAIIDKTNLGVIMKYMAPHR